MHVVQGPPGKQPLAEGGYHVEIKVNGAYMYNRPNVQSTDVLASGVKFDLILQANEK